MAWSEVIWTLSLLHDYYPFIERLPGELDAESTYDIFQIFGVARHDSHADRDRQA